VREIGGLTVDEFLERVSGVELTEWGALLAGEDRQRQLIADGVDPELAARMVWGAPDE
jgi:hypothetical protein